jgi:drug/metabolite transporter (DMT)-like permease
MISVWGFSFVLVDIAVEFIPPLSVALYRFLIASITFLLIDIFQKLVGRKKSSIDIESKNYQRFSKKDWYLILLASFTGVSFFFLAQYTSIAIIGPSLPALFVCLLAPVFITIFALILFSEKLNMVKITGFLIASIGGFLLITGGDMKTLAPDSPIFIGYMLALITPLLWAVYSTVSKKITKTNSNLRMLKFIAYLGTMELFLFVLINNEFLIFVSNFFNIVVILCALYLGIGCYLLGYYIWQNAQLKLKSSQTASFLYIEPFITLLFSFLLKRSETIILWNIVGGIIVLIAVLMINYK